MRNAVTRFALAAAVVVLTMTPAAADSYGRSYSLHTLDYRTAESMIWDLCEEMKLRSDRCKVQTSSPGGLVVLAEQEAHARIVKLLAEHDVRVPSSLLFEIVLVRLKEGGDAKTPIPGHLQKAVDAVLEIFPDRTPEVLDTGVIRTVGHGKTRLGSPGSGYYDAELALRSTTSDRDGMEFTVELQIAHRTESSVTGVLQSTLTIGEGETAVAGSSRVGGEPTIVVLVTSKPS